MIFLVLLLGVPFCKRGRSWKSGLNAGFITWKKRPKSGCLIFEFQISTSVHMVPVVGLEPTRCCHQRILSRTFERANKVKIRRYNPFKVRIKAHCAALFPRWSVKSIAASNNLKAWFNFNHYNVFWSKITDAFTTFGWQILIVQKWGKYMVSWECF